MVNILFLIGNGFDLNLGLKTSFTDIVKEYKSTYKNTEEKYIQDYILELEQHNKEWSYFERQLGLYIKNFNKKTKNTLLAQIDSFVKVMIEKLEDEQDRIDITIKNNHIISALFNNSLANFIQYLPEVSQESLSPLLEISKRNTDFNYDFISFNYTNTFERLLSVVKDHAKNKSLRVLKNNPDTVIKDNIGTVLHIHGTLKEDFILGVDNKYQIANKRLSDDDDIQCLIKPYQNNSIGANNEKKAKQLIDKSNIICIYGMSIGETDKTWWEYIYKWLSADSSRHLVIFYYNNKLNIQLPKSKINHKNKVLKSFFSVIDNADDFDNERIKDNIHIPFGNQSMFNIDIVDIPKPTFRKTYLFSDPLLLNNAYSNIAKITKANPDLAKIGKQVNQVSEILKKSGF